MPNTRVTSSFSVGVELDGETSSPTPPVATPPTRIALLSRNAEAVKSDSWSSSSSSDRQLRSNSNLYPELKIKINSGNGAPPWEGSTSSPLSTNSSISYSAEPFNLISFFPTTELRSASEDSGSRSRSGSGSGYYSYPFGGGREWNWLNEERSSVNSEDLSGTETEYEFDEMVIMGHGRLENEDKIRKIGIADVAGQVIDGEDKFGILGLTSGNVAKTLFGGILGRFLGRLGEGGGGGERRAVNEDYGPEDIEEVCSRYREREEKRNKTF